MQRERVQDQYPWTWEIPAAVIAVVALAVVLSWQLGRSIANWFAGAGWLWPGPGQLISSIPGLIAGDAAAGVHLNHPGAAAVALWAWMAIATVLLLTAGSAAGLGGWRRWGHGSIRGMATVNEAQAILGVGRLRRVRSIVRPDLYPTRHRQRTTR